MFSYNDFSLPNDYFIDKYNEEFLKEKNKERSTEMVKEVLVEINLIHSNIESLVKWAKNKNAIIEAIMTCKSSLILLYPNTNQEKPKADTNFISLLSSLSNCLNKLIKIESNETRKFYSVTLKKIIIKLSSALNDLISPLKEKEIKIFQYM